VLGSKLATHLLRFIPVGKHQIGVLPMPPVIRIVCSLSSRSLKLSRGPVIVTSRPTRGSSCMKHEAPWLLGPRFTASKSIRVARLGGKLVYVDVARRVPDRNEAYLDRWLCAVCAVLKVTCQRGRRAATRRTTWLPW
jgi:hypothetical protein